ncbi:cytochrome c oxidase assembly protein [Ruania zhangjianzhongii]|uniref:cytochrome c oxidase assembly protein n=1 Tax=Ruania zhangjianzhongii TaxID=2603206 RepID=UPI001FD3C4C2|nr:cytochrome c oxidase assembly protein [Ruania zhangjianzhongii]
MPEQPAPSSFVRRPTPARWVWSAVPAALLACLASLAFSGAAAPTVIADSGAVVRWGRPLVSLGWQLAAAVTIGGLSLLLFALPRQSRAWPTAARTVAIAGPLWAMLMVADLFFGYANVAGRQIGGENFGDELAFYLTEISSGRAALVAAILAALASIAAVAVAGYGTAVLAAVAALAVLVPIATTGHASGAANHELGMTGLYFHVLFAALWLGGLAVLVLISRRLGDELALVAGRYSTLALWCFGGVAVTGIANAWIRLGGLEGFATDYGVLLLVKIVGFLALGAAGYVHRERTIPALTPAGGKARPGLFWRLVGVEVVVMSAVMGVAVALADTGPPIPQEAQEGLSPAEELSQYPVPPAPTLATWFTQWRAELLFGSVAVLLAVMYVRWVLRLRRRGDSWPLARTITWLVGAVGFAYVTCSGPAVYGRLMFSAHMLQHMTMVTVLPILFALGAPVTLALRALPARKDGSRGPREWLLGLVNSRVAHFFGHPVVAAANFAGSMILFYFTPLFELALTTHIGHIAMVVHFSLAGYLFVNVLVGVDPGPTRPAYPLRLLLLFATMAFHAFFGVSLISMESLIAADYFGALGLPWGVDALADQHTGGEITWGIGELPSITLAVALAVGWIRSDRRTERRLDRRADRDDDAELVAYNAMLERMASEEERGTRR